ncbi:hypothetical protein [Actinomadura sp. CNU-125]|nr:hypothetical protein [Actinomadura sp. CNU-125]
MLFLLLFVYLFGGTLGNGHPDGEGRGGAGHCAVSVAMDVKRSPA